MSSTFEHLYRQFERPRLNRRRVVKFLSFSRGNALPDRNSSMRVGTPTLTARVAVGALTLTLFSSFTPPTKAFVRSVIGATELTIVARDGDPAPADIGGVLSHVVSCSVSESGAVAYCAVVDDSSVSSVLVFGDGNVTRTLLRSGDLAPDGGVFSSFEQVDVAQLAPTGTHAAEDLLLFSAKLENGSSPEGIFLYRNGQAEPIAFVGGASPRGRIWSGFASISLTCISVTTPDDLEPVYQITYVGFTVDGHTSLVIWPSYDPMPGEVLSTGDWIKTRDAIVEGFTASPSGLSVACVAHIRRQSTGRRNHKVIIADYGGLVVGNALHDGTKVPGLGRVLEIEEPPAVLGQAAVVATSFSRGGSALLLRDVGGAATAFVKSGDQASGLPKGETLQTFASPVATRFPAGSMTVVSDVTTSGGLRALLVQVFSGQVPPIETDRTATLLDGAAVVNGESVSLTSFTPVKLTSSGSVLIKATIGVSTGYFLLPSMIPPHLEP